jgi:hypothetical protein
MPMPVAPPPEPPTPTPAIGPPVPTPTPGSAFDDPNLPRPTYSPRPLVPNALEVDPTEGLGGVRIGASTVEDALEAFRRDGRVFRLEPSQAVLSISYDYDEAGRYKPDPDGNHHRPAELGFDPSTGLLSKMKLSVYQRGLFTTGGLNTQSSTADDVTRVLGPCPDVLSYGPTTMYR